MLMKEATEEMLIEWKAVYAQYRHKLSPNRKTPGQIIAFLEQSYPLTEIKDEMALATVEANLISNTYFRDKLAPGEEPFPRVYLVESTGTGKVLYDQQDELFEGNKILVGIDQTTGYFMVEGSSLLWDELFVYAGLDLQDLENIFLVAQYVDFLKKRGLLEEVQEGFPE